MCEEWRENENVGTYVTAKHDNELHEQFNAALDLLKEIDARPSKFQDGGEGIERVHEFIQRYCPKWGNGE